MEYTTHFDRQTEQYPIVDLVKYLCALLVVSIHIAPLSSFFEQFPISKYLNYGIQNYIARIGVPFYFASAGFFLFRKIEFDSIDLSITNTKKYAFKLLRILGTWIVLLFVGATFPLWYMGGLVIAVCFLPILLYNGVSFQKMVVIAYVYFPCARDILFTRLCGEHID